MVRVRTSIYLEEGIVIGAQARRRGGQAASIDLHGNFPIGVLDRVSLDDDLTLLTLPLLVSKLH